jgi:glycosyltransferase involved in cell wall biosynthesis
LDLVSVVVPVCENAPSLPGLLDRLRAVADGIPAVAFEFVFVDDGSGDGSFALLKEQGRFDPRLRAIRLSRNFGSNAAVLAGLTHSRGRCVAVIAADLQDPPELLPQMIELWREGAEVVLAARRRRNDPLLTRMFAAAFNRLFRRLVFSDFPVGGFDFVLMGRRVVDLLARMSEKNSYIFGQVMWAGFERRILYYDRGPRLAGSSRWTLAKRVKYFIDAFTAFSYLPVRLASLLGTLLALAGFAYAAVVVVWHFAGRIREPGFAALIVALLIVSGTQLVIIGIMGEYLWRVLEESRRRPSFVVEATWNVEQSPREAKMPSAPPLGA